jgi:hypothetical protein
VSQATQLSPYPEILRDLVERLTYKRGWYFYLQELVREGQGETLSQGLTLNITVRTTNSVDGEPIGIAHYMPVPPATYDEWSWKRWLFDQILLVERHEAMEFFKIDGYAPYFPDHGPGESPYRLTERQDLEVR